MQLQTYKDWQVETHDQARQYPIIKTNLLGHEMHTPAWQVAAWGKVSLNVAEWDHLTSNFRCLGISDSGVDMERGLRFGQAVWGAGTEHDGHVGLAWDWREVRPGVVAMADPMTVVSNVVLLEDGNPIESLKQILHLNNAIFSLPWQELGATQ